MRTLSISLFLAMITVTANATVVESFEKDGTGLILLEDKIDGNESPVTMDGSGLTWGGYISLEPGNTHEFNVDADDDCLRLDKRVIQAGAYIYTRFSTLEDLSDATSYISIDADAGTNTLAPASDVRVMLRTGGAWYVCDSGNDILTGIVTVSLDGKTWTQVTNPEVLDDGFASANEAALLFGTSGMDLSVATGSGLLASVDGGGLYFAGFTKPDKVLEVFEIVWQGAGGPPVNIPPNVNAGSDQESDFAVSSGIVQLSGTADDGGDGPGPFTTTWSKASGPGNANFSSTSILNPTVTFTSPGLYQLQLLADDGEDIKVDTVQIEVMDFTLEGYFVALNGNNSNTGTIYQPWATIQHAVDQLIPGDTLYIRGGRYHQTVNIDNLDGTSSDPIRIRNYPGEEVVIAGTTHVTSSWSLHSGNIYKTTIGKDIWQLFVDGKSMVVARWPNISKNWDEPDDSSGWDPTPDSYWDQDATWAQLGNASVWGHLYNKEGAQQLAAENKSFNGAVLNIFRCIVTGNDIIREKITSHTAGQSDFTHSTTVYPIDSKVKKALSDGRFFIEGDFDCLDAPGEWFYDKSNGELYAWFKDSGIPDGRYIEGRHIDNVMTIYRSQHLNISGITLFGGALYLNATKDTNFDECKFLYPSSTKMMLGEILGTVKNESDNAQYPANLSWTNCEFAYSEGRALALDTHGNLVENNYFHNSGWGPTTFGVVADKKGSHTTYRRNTLHTIGRSNGTKNGQNCLIEWNRTYNFMFKGDSCGHQMPTGTQSTTVCRYNWVYNGYHRNGFRFDGDPGGTNGTIHHNVSMHNNRGFRLKGDQHQIYSLTGLFNGPKDDCNVSLQKYYDAQGNQAGNINSIVRNIAAYFINPWPISTVDKAGIWHGLSEGATLESQLRDPSNLDFRPKAGSDLVDAGTHVPGFTDGYIGSAPDIGAYEYGETNYWIPGCKFKNASCPIPPHDSVTAKIDADLMWLESRNASSYRVHFGPNPANLTDFGTQTNNIFDPGTLSQDTFYYWRIDTITPTETITGDTWSFYTGESGSTPPDNRPPYFRSLTIHEPDGTVALPYSNTIGDEGVDPDGDPLIYSKQAGPAWLAVELDGTTHGTPGPGDAGQNTWSVRVTDSHGDYDEAIMDIAIAAGHIGNPDINGSGTVNLSDFAIISSHWQDSCSASSWCEGTDLNFNGTVNITDLRIFAASWLN
jgi:hypothetical protein